MSKSIVVLFTKSIAVKKSIVLKREVTEGYCKGKVPYIEKERPNQKVRGPNRGESGDLCRHSGCPIAKKFFGITFLGTRLKSATKPPYGLDGLRPDPLTVRSVKAGVQGKEFF